MLQPMKNYIYERRRGFTTTAGFAGGFYIATRYVKDRLEEVKDRVMQERIARDNLRRRFEQNREDVSYTIMALMPTLADQVLGEMDVEALTSELQLKSRSSRASPQLLAPHSESSPSSSASVLTDQDTRSDADSMAMSATFSAAGSSSIQEDVSHASSSSYLADSSTTTSSWIHAKPSSPNAATSSRSKAELWQEVKILSFTRTLTVVYASVLLALFTTVQLTLLARSKYVQSVVQLEREERERDRQLDLASLLAILDEQEPEDVAESKVNLNVDEESEMMYLILSWWILHVGWKDIGERVRKGVEDVFDSVSLKSKLGPVELHRLISDVRRRVEHEVTFEGHERRTTFASTLLPPTPETTQHVLTQGGWRTPSHARNFPPAFNSLLEETRKIVQSANFARVLEVGLERATAVLFDGLERGNAFGLDGNGQLEGDGGSEGRVRLAGLLPGLARWSSLALTGLPNELIEVILFHLFKIRVSKILSTAWSLGPLIRPKYRSLSISSSYPLTRLLAGNSAWADSVNASEPQFFQNTVKGQFPKILWLGCADSRVPESVITAARPGDIFVHRNVANQFKPDDPSALAVLSYAINQVGVEHVVVVGHTQCGGALACLQAAQSSAHEDSRSLGFPIPDSPPNHPLNSWLEPLTSLARSLPPVTLAMSTEDALPHLVVANVKKQVPNVAAAIERLADTPAARSVSVHGWIYEVEHGRLKDLGVSSVTKA